MQNANMMNANIFERSEIKFLASDFQRAALLSALRDFLTPDPHGESTVCNIYYDTTDFRLIRHSLEKPAYKEKLRIRSYGPAAPDQEIFLELKKKFDGIVYKRRISLPLAEAEAFLAGKMSWTGGDAADPAAEGQAETRGFTSCVDRQIARELTWFRDFYGTLEPAVHLCYDRSAYYAKDDPNFRITFDRNIRWETDHLSLTAAPAGAQILKPGQSILEIKTAGSIPLEIVRLISRLQIPKASLSKYGKAYETMLGDRTSKAWQNTMNIRSFPGQTDLNGNAGGTAAPVRRRNA